MKKTASRVAYFGAIAIALVLEPGEIEYAIAPVVSPPRHTIISDMYGQVCVQTEFVRKRKARATAISWTATSRGRQSVFLLMYRQNMPGSVLMAQPDQVGKNIVYVNCHTRPKMFGGQAYQITTNVAYSVAWQPFWQVYRSDPPLTIPAEKR